MTATELDDRLTDLLARSATAVDVQSDLDAVLAGDRGDAPVVDLGRRPRDTRRLLALASAIVMVLGLAGVVALVARGGDEPLSTADGPTGIHPVADVLPPEVADDTWIVTMQEGSMTGTGAMEAPVARAVLGTREDDGSLTEVDTVLLGRPGPQPFAEVDGEDLTVAGRRARATTTADGATLVVIEGDPTLTIEGAGDLVDRLERIPDGGLETGWDGDRPTLEVGAGGPEVLVPAGPLDDGPSPTLTAGSDPAPYVMVSTQTDEPVAELALGGARSLEPVAIGDVTGYQVPDDGGGGQVAWTTAEGTDVVVRAVGLDDGTALAVARGLRLVDRATWLGTYDQHGPDLTDSRVVDRPAPTVRGPELDGTAYRPPQLDGEWTIVSLTASWCVPCVAMLDELGPTHDRLHDSARASVVSLLVEDTPEAARRLVEDHDVGWQVVPLEDDEVEAWGVAGVPATVFVDPDGIVQAVVDGSMTGAEVETTLASLGG